MLGNNLKMSTLEIIEIKGLPGGSDGKASVCNAAMQETWVQALGWGDPLEKEMAIHSSTIA